MDLSISPRYLETLAADMTDSQDKHKKKDAAVFEASPKDVVKDDDEAEVKLIPEEEAVSIPLQPSPSFLPVKLIKATRLLSKSRNL